MAAATMYVTVAGAGDKSGDSWANAMDLAAWVNDMVNNMEAGDDYRVYSGTYTLTGNMNTAKVGSTTYMCTVTGVSDQDGDGTEATGDDRPLIAAAANQFIFEDYTLLKNIRLTSTETFGVGGDANNQITNCKSTQTGGNSAFRFAGLSNRFIDCEAISDGYGVYLDTGYCSFYSFVVKECSIGINSNNASCLLYCIFDTCDAGIIPGNFNMITNCTFFGDKENEAGTMYGIDMATKSGNTIMNNIFYDCDVGVDNAAERYNYLDYNDYHSNTTDVNNVTKGSNALAVDPQFTDATNGDFSIGTNLKAQGFPGEFPGGLSTGYLDVGAVQREEAGGTANLIKGTLIG